MYFQYVDEAGCPGPLLEGDSEIQPVLSLVGVTIPEKNLRYLTDEFLDLKQQFFPSASRSRHALDWVLAEVKGSEISRTLRLGSKNDCEHNLLFLGALLNLVEQYEGVIQGKVYFKPLYSIGTRSFLCPYRQGYHCLLRRRLSSIRVEIFGLPLRRL